MKKSKYQLPIETLLGYIEFKNGMRKISHSLPFTEKELIQESHNKLDREDNKLDREGEIHDYYSHSAFLDLYRLLEDHQEYFYPSDSDRSRIKQLITGSGPSFTTHGDIPQAIGFTSEEIMENIDWVTEDTIRELLQYDQLEYDITEIFWDKVIYAHDHKIYNLPWLRETKDELIEKIGLSNIQNFMGDIGNPNYDEAKELKEVRKFIYNVI